MPDWKLIIKNLHMKKILLLFFCLLSLAATTLRAQQTGAIRGTLVDAGTKESVIGAVIEVHNTRTPDEKKAYTTAGDGLISVTGLAYGEYSLKFSFLGYKDLVRTVTVNQPTVQIGTLELEEDRLRIEDVVLEVPAIRTSIKGDTVSYNASAFKVSSDADAERLVSKMPGISVVNGTVEAQGEEVKKVLVDGREFFGQDVTTALKSLPAEMVDRVEVFDKLSDQAEFTGIDDGQGYKAINIVTALDKRSGQFGKIAASYGYPDYYYANAAVNIFSGDSRVSLLGLVNNLNQQNFSMEDIVGATTSSSGGRGGGGHWGAGRDFMVRPQAGIATVQAFGVNYMDKWGKKNKVDVTGSYFFNHTDTRNENFTEEWFTNPATGLVQYTRSESDSNADNFNHRFNGRIDYKINDRQSLMIRPSFSYQDYDSYSGGLSYLSYITNGSEEEIRMLNQIQERDSYGYNAGLNVLFRTRIGDKAGRTLTVNANGNSGLNNGTQLPKSFYFYAPYNGRDPEDTTLADSTAVRRVLSDSRNYELSGSVTYSEPLSAKSSLNLEYRANYRYSDSDYRTFLFLDNAGYPVNHDFNYEYDEFLSNIANSGYMTHRVNPGYRYNDKKINFNVGLTYQNATLRNTQEVPVITNPEQTHSFSNFLYSARLRYNINTANSLNLFVNSDTRNPSISQLQDVVNISGTNISTGNPDLVPSMSHRLRAHYNLSLAEKGTTFGVFFGGSLTNNYIANHVVTVEGTPIPNTDGMVLEKGGRFTRPENMDGYWNFSAGVSLGMPVRFLKSNFNIMVGGSMSEIPSKTDNVTTLTNTKGVYAQVSLGSNISENVDFMLNYRGSYDLTDYSAGNLAGAGNRDSELFTQFATASLKWVFWKGITFSTNATFRHYYRPTEDTNEHYVTVNALIGKKIFKNQRGELSLIANDIFNQNKSYYTSVTNNTITNNSNLEIGRYFGVQFVYNLRLYGKGASRKSSDYDGLDQDRSGSMQRQGGFRPGMGGGGHPPMGGHP